MSVDPSALFEAEPYWVCHDCRSINELRHTHCYSCGLGRDVAGELEVIVDQPAGQPARFDVPAGSPFAAIAANPMQIEGRGIGVPVMGDPSIATDAVAVGPGRPGVAVAVPVVAEDGGALMLSDMAGEDDAEREATVGTSRDPVTKRHR